MADENQGRGCGKEKVDFVPDVGYYGKLESERKEYEMGVYEERLPDCFDIWLEIFEVRRCTHRL